MREWQGEMGRGAVDVVVAAGVVSLAVNAILTRGAG